MAKLKVITIGNSLGVVFSKDLLAKLCVKKGDLLYAKETPEGITLTLYNPVFTQEIEEAEKIIRENYDILKKLAEYSFLFESFYIHFFCFQYN